MKFLLDQDVYGITARLLINLGHDVIQASTVELSQATDETLLLYALRHERILVTRDRDFGNLVLIKNMGYGVLYLRILPSTQNAVHLEIQRVLSIYSETELKHSFVVIEPTGHRIRRLHQG